MCSSRKPLGFPKVTFHRNGYLRKELGCEELESHGALSCLPDSEGAWPRMLLEDLLQEALVQGAGQELGLGACLPRTDGVFEAQDAFLEERRRVVKQLCQEHG